MIISGRKLPCRASRGLPFCERESLATTPDRRSARSTASHSPLAVGPWTLGASGCPRLVTAPGRARVAPLPRPRAAASGARGEDAGGEARREPRPRAACGLSDDRGLSPPRTVDTQRGQDRDACRSSPSRAGGTGAARDASCRRGPAGAARSAGAIRPASPRSDGPAWARLARTCARACSRSQRRRTWTRSHERNRFPTSPCGISSPASHRRRPSSILARKHRRSLASSGVASSGRALDASSARAFGAEAAMPAAWPSPARRARAHRRPRPSAAPRIASFGSLIAPASRWRRQLHVDSASRRSRSLPRRPCAWSPGNASRPSACSRSSRWSASSVQASRTGAARSLATCRMRRMRACTATPRTDLDTRAGRSVVKRVTPHACARARGPTRPVPLLPARAAVVRAQLKPRSSRSPPAPRPCGGAARRCRGRPARPRRAPRRRARRRRLAHHGGGEARAARAREARRGVALDLAGEVGLNTAERIVVENDRAVGVDLAGGERLTARKVVSNLDPTSTFRRLLGESLVPRDCLESVKAIDHRGAYVRIQLALAKLATFGGEWAWLNEGRYRANVSIFDGPEMLHENWVPCRRREVPRDPCVGFPIPSVLDPELAPPGRHAGTAFARCFPCEAPRAQHGRLKDEVADRIVDALERCAPGFRDGIPPPGHLRALPPREHARLHRRRLLPRPDPPGAGARLPPRARLGRRLPDADRESVPVRRRLPPRPGRHVLARRRRGARGAGEFWGGAGARRALAPSMPSGAGPVAPTSAPGGASPWSPESWPPSASARSARS